MMLSRATEDDYGHNQTQTGVLCKKCDEMLGKYEDERAALLNDNANVQFGSAHKVLSGYNPSYVKAAFLADIFRCSCFNLKCCRDVNIGDKHEERISNLLDIGNSGECDEYSIWLFKMSGEGDLIDGVGMYPHKCKFYGLTCYRALYPGGWEWIMKMDSRKGDIDRVSSFYGGDVVVLNGGDFKKSGLYSEVLDVV